MLSPDCQTARLPDCRTANTLPPASQARSGRAEPTSLFTLLSYQASRRCCTVHPDLLLEFHGIPTAPTFARYGQRRPDALPAGVSAALPHLLDHGRARAASTWRQSWGSVSHKRPRAPGCSSPCCGLLCAPLKEDVQAKRSLRLRALVPMQFTLFRIRCSRPPSAGGTLQIWVRRRIARPSRPSRQRPRPRY